jgi:hypothetical protein
MNQARRYILTINNPFFNAEHKEADISNTKLPLALDYMKLDHLKAPNVIDCFDFKFIEWQVNNETKIIERPYFKNMECVVKYVQSLEHFKYSIFQQEKVETEHIQMFLVFTVGKMFNTIKTYFPTAHIEECKGSNVQCRDYCSKTETRIGEVYELGQFAEERARTDIAGFFEALDSGMTNTQLKKLYPSIFARVFQNIDKMRQDSLFEEYKKKFRNIETTYIYGKTGIGKTSYIYEKFGFNIYRVTNYGYHPFDYYEGQDIIIFDEFDSSFKITEMLNYLDRYPLALPCRFNDKVACYTKIFIISNKTIKEQYPNIQTEKMEQYNAFLRRIHNIARMDNNGNLIYEKQNGQEIKQFEFVKVNDTDLPW